VCGGKHRRAVPLCVCVCLCVEASTAAQCLHVCVCERVFVCGGKHHRAVPVCVCVCVCVSGGKYRRAVTLDGETCGISAGFPKVEDIVIAARR